MPAAKVAVLNLDEGVSQEDYTRTLGLLRDQMNEYRVSQGWCSQFWEYISTTISPVFSYDEYNEQVTVRDDTRTSDADRAEELRNIRGRILAYVGERITLPRANEVLRNAGLAEYVRGGKGTPHQVAIPSFTFSVTTDKDPAGEIQEKFAEFLAAAGDSEAEYHASRVYTRESSDSYSVPEGDTVRLLNR